MIFADSLTAVPACKITFLEAQAFLPVCCLPDAYVAPSRCPRCRHTQGGVHGGVLNWVLDRISSSKIMEFSSTQVAEGFVADEILYAALVEPPLDVRGDQLPDEILCKLPRIRHTLSDGWVAKFLQKKKKNLKTTFRSVSRIRIHPDPKLFAYQDHNPDP